MTYWKNEENIIWVDKIKNIEDKNSCFMCNKLVNFIDCDNEDLEICSNCGFVRSKKPWKLIINQFGYYIEGV